MTKSGRAVDFYFFGTMFLFMCLTFLSFVLIAIKWGEMGENVGGVMVVILAMALLFGQYMWRSGHRILADGDQHEITFINFFFGQRKVYSFGQLDGYCTGRVKRGRFGSEKVILLVRRGRIIIRIDGTFVKNINEIEKELKSLKYLGYQVINFRQRLSMLLGIMSIK